MILDDDQQVQVSIRDSLPITTDILKELGWEYISSSSQNYGGYYVYWTVWRFHDSYIQLIQDGRCYYNVNRFDVGSEIRTVKELREKMFQF